MNQARSNAKPQTCDVLIVGAGFTGLYAIHKLRGLGLRVQAVEKGTGGPASRTPTCVDAAGRVFPPV
jgi:cation diffusion facilitator CzcD-associated flavoprotein CzcO